MIEPLLDLSDEGGHLLLEIAVPGILESDIDVAFSGTRLVLTAERPEAGGRRYLRHEIERGLLVRVVELPFEVELVRSGYEDGVLRLELRRLS